MKQAVTALLSKPWQEPKFKVGQTVHFEDPGEFQTGPFIVEKCKRVNGYMLYTSSTGVIAWESWLRPAEVA